MTHPLTTKALLCPHTQKSFATLDKHEQSSSFDRDAAIRLLLSNARDVVRKHAPNASFETRRTIALELLQEWEIQNG